MNRGVSKKLVFFLLNDMHIYASRGLSSYKVKKVIPIDTSFTVRMSSMVSSNAFEIHSVKQSFIAIASSNELKEAWLADLRECVRRARILSLWSQPDEARGSRHIDLAPIMQVTSSCSICSARFSIFRRRYNCSKW